MSAGVRHGCPLSSLVYVLVTETLLDMIEEEVKDVLVRAYADDTALPVKDTTESIPELEKLFVEFQDLSGLRINVSKSELVPLNNRGLDANRRHLECIGKSWNNMQVSYSAKYLGFMMIPWKAQIFGLYDDTMEGRHLMV